MTKDNKETYKNKEFTKEIEVKEGNNAPKKVQIKILKEQPVEVDDKTKDTPDLSRKLKVKILDKSVTADKDKKIDDVTEKEVDVILDYKKGTWWPYFEVKKVENFEIKEPKKTGVMAVQGHKHWWPTWTLIIGGSIIGVAVTVGLIWALLKKDGDEE